MPADEHPVQRLLERLRRKEEGAAAELFQLVYDDLHRVARGLMRGIPEGNTLQPTALVHEAYLRLTGDSTKAWENRSHFMGIAAKAMRAALVDHCRAKSTRKRGGDRKRMPLDDVVELFEQRSVDLVGLNDLLDELARLDEQAGQIVELRFFAGLTIEETARALEVSTATVERNWRTARAWMRTRMR